MRVPPHAIGRNHILEVLEANNIPVYNAEAAKLRRCEEDFDLYLFDTSLYVVRHNETIWNDVKAIGELSISEFMEVYGGAPSGVIQFDEKQFTEMLCGS